MFDCINLDKLGEQKKNLVVLHEHKPIVFICMYAMHLNIIINLKLSIKLKMSNLF